MVKLRKGKRVYAPSSALGIMRFFDVESKAPKLKPELVIFLSVAFIAVILIMHALTP